MQKVTNSSIKINKLKLLAQLILLGIVFFFVFDKGIIREFKLVFEMLDMRNIDKVVTYFILPIKTFYDLSQLVSFTYFVFKIILAVVIVPLIIYFVVKTISKVFVNKKQHSYNFESISTANFKAVYIVQQKFLC